MTLVADLEKVSDGCFLVDCDMSCHHEVISIGRERGRVFRYKAVRVIEIGEMRHPRPKIESSCI